MKRILKILGFIGVSVVCCLVLGIYCGSIITSGSTCAQNTGGESFISESSTVALFSNERTESSLNLYNRTHRTNVKNSFNQFTACQVVAVKLFSYGYLPFIYCFSSCFIQFKNTDIIFPFHYFW